MKMLKLSGCLALIIIPAVISGQSAFFTSQGLEKYVTDPGAHPVRTVTSYVKSPDGKTVTDSATFSAIVPKGQKRPGDIVIPASFTPDGDGIEDNFIVSHPGMKSLAVYVYNAKGELVFESSSTINAWDGTTVGKTCGEGSYVYYIEARLTSGEFIRQKGALTLTRNQ